MIIEKREEQFKVLNELLCEINEISIQLNKDQKEKNIDTKDIRKGLQLVVDILVDKMFELRWNENNDRS